MADINAMVSKLERKVQPTDDFYKFSPEALKDEIEEALIHYDSGLSIEVLNKEQELMVMYKAMSSCYYLLASKHAENMRFRIENDEYHGDQPHRAYLALAEKYEKLYESNSGISVHTVTRTQTGTGRKAPYYVGDTP
jgi:hypothetical protein